MAEATYRCQFCWKESPIQEWAAKKDHCPECGMEYDPILAQEEDIVAAYYVPPEGDANNMACRSLAMGSSAYHAAMAAELFNQHATPVLEHANRIQRTATRRRKR